MQFIDSWLCSMRHLYPVCVHLLNIFAYTIGKVLFECFCLFLIVPLEIIQCSIPQSKHFTYFSLKVIVIFFFLLFFYPPQILLKSYVARKDIFVFLIAESREDFSEDLTFAAAHILLIHSNKILTKFYIYTRTIFSTIK